MPSKSALIVAALAATLVTSCSKSTTPSGPKSPPPGTGSCTYKNPAGNYCGESTDPDFYSRCPNFGGTWSDAPCDQSLYARRCVQEGEGSYVYYYPAGSEMSCLGETTPLR